MNTKTTLYLVVLLAALASAYLFMESRPAPEDADANAAPKPATANANVDLLEEPLGDVVKVSCRRRGGDEWIFVKDTESPSAGQPAWNMTAPTAMKCVSWEVGRFSQQLGTLQYSVSYTAGEPGAVTPEQAGLTPPVATVALTDDTDKTVTIEIGKSAAASETYVRRRGTDRICVANRDLSTLIKDKLLDYREKQLWNFEKNNVTRVEVTDRSDPTAPADYAFAKDGARWMMEAPVTARATAKVDEMLNAMSRQRVMEWNSDDPSKLAMYGLDPAHWTVRVTVQETLAPDPATAQDEEPQAPETKTTVYKLHLSDRSPIGQDTKTYARIGDESAVGAIMKTAADKYKPVMAEWREMRVTAANVNAASRIELTTPDGSTTLNSQAGAWSFTEDGGRAEDTAVAELLETLSELNAVAFVDDASTDLATYGLDAPAAELRLTIPGLEHAERIAIGDFTDQQTKRLRYLRRNDLATIAKVKTADVEKIIQGPNTYRDRTLVVVLPSRFEKLVLSSPDPFTGRRSSTTLQRTGVEWNLAEPVAAPVRSDQVDKLVETLGGLRATGVVGDQSQASAFGLHDPPVTVALTYKPRLEYRIPEAETEDEPAEPVEVQPPSKTVELALSRQGANVYAMLADRPTVYEVAPDLYTQLLAEYRSDRVVDFDETKVTQFSIRKDDVTHTFEKTEEKWAYRPEPDMPLDTTKVDNLLLQIRDLRTPRFVRHTGANLAEFNLATPLHEITVTMDNGSAHTLVISDKPSTAPQHRGFFASRKGDGAVFLLNTDAVKRIEVNLDDLE